MNLGEYLKQAAGPNLGPQKERIEYIHIDKLVSDERNFYELSGIDALAENIELIGLQQPIRVREIPGEGKYRIVSGHRRRAAIQKLVDEGREDLRSVHCIVETVECSDAMQELRLIYANSDTRKMSSADLSRQAERVEALLYQLKEEGFEFPGRMRDHVAQACQTSKSKLSRLKVIREKLADVWMPSYERGELNDACAYALAQISEDWQRKIYTTKMSKNPDLKYFYQSTVEVRRDYLAALEKLKCKKCGGTCKNADGKFTHLTNPSYSYDNCHKKCCDNCENLSNCKQSCPLLAEKVKKLKADKKEARLQAELAQKAVAEPKVQLLSDLWSRFGVARAAAKMSVKDFREAIGGRYYGVSDEKEFREKENCENITEASSLPYGYNFDYLNVKRLIDAADCLGVSLDYLFCRTDQPQQSTTSPADNKPAQIHPSTGWRTDQPAVGQVAVVMQDYVVNKKGEEEFDLAVGQYTTSGWAEFELESWQLKNVEKWFPIQIGNVQPSPEPIGQLVFNGWMPGGTNPATPCEVIAVFNFEDGGEPYKKICYWNGHLWKSSRTGTVCDMEPSRWMALPPDE